MNWEWDGNCDCMAVGRVGSRLGLEWTGNRTETGRVSTWN